MNYEQKLHALKKLNFSTHLEMREPGNWYVSAGMELADGEHCLRGAYGNGSSPEEAVNAHWEIYGSGQPLKCRESWWRWNGFMWEESSRPQNAPRL